MDRGVLLFAHNNTEIDYMRIACINALMIQHNLGVGVSVVTDPGTYKWAVESLGQEFVDRCFEQVIVTDPDYVYKQKNGRVFRDTAHTSKTLEFYNCDHWQAYDLTPYNETLFIDADYLIMSDALSACWGSSEEFMINKDVTELYFGRRQEKTTIGESGVDLYWATCIYFKKSELAETAFKIVQHVYENYRYYNTLYAMPSGMFRNDFAFSIAVHILNGFTNNHSVKQLPVRSIYKSFDNDDIIEFDAINSVKLLLEKPKCQGDYIIAKVQDLDVHIMNKWAINRHFDRIMELYNV